MSGRRIKDEKIARARRAIAMDRVELRYPSAPRVAPAGLTSMAVKMRDPVMERMVADALERKKVRA